MNWIDDVERELIIRFFAIDPVQSIDPISGNYQLGHSTFSNIIDFYKFEYKSHEKVFWDILLPAISTLPDIQMPIEMSKVDVGYIWLDYVTSVDICYRVVYDRLILTIQHDENPHKQALILICNMMFISDFREIKDTYKNVNIDNAWLDLLRQTNDFKQSLLH